MGGVWRETSIIEENLAAAEGTMVSFILSQSVISWWT